MSPPDNRNHPLDNILTEVGEFGKFQFISFTLLCFGIIMHSSINVAFAFTAMDLEYRCFVPSCDSVKNTEYNPNWLKDAVPFKSGDLPTKCQKYREVNITVDYGDNCTGKNFDKNLTDSCSLYVYKTDERSILQDFNLYCDENVWKLTLVGTMNIVGVFFGIFFAGILSDRFGRRNVLVIGLMLCSLCGILRAFVNSYQLFILLEFLDAAFGSGAYAISFILVVELVGPSKRVLTGSIICCSFAFGEILTASVAWTLRAWRPLLVVLYSPLLLTISYYWLVPESVRWLLSQKRYDEVKAILRRAAKVNNKTVSEISLEKLCEENKTNQESHNKVSKELLLEFFKSKTLTVRVVNCCFCWMTCAFSFYGLTLNSVALAGNSYLDFILSALIEIPAYVAVYLLVDKIGRRASLSSSFFIAGFSCFAVIFIPTTFYSLQLPVYLLGKFGATAAFTVCYVITSEIFPTPLRSSLLSACSMVGRIGNMLAPQAPLLAQLWEPLPLTLFSTFAILAGLTSLFLPETLYIKLPDTIHEAELLGKKPKLAQRN